MEQVWVPNDYTREARIIQPEVGSPFWPTTSKSESMGFGGLAQLGERLPCKQEVSGSIPLISTKNGPIAQLARAHDW